MTPDPEVIKLREHEDRELNQDRLSLDAGEQLWREHRSAVSVEFPSVKTGGNWVLRSKGYIGQIPLEGGPVLILEPKVPLANLFQMIDQAADFESLSVLDELYEAETMEDLFDTVARILAKRVLGRVRRGLYKSYRRISRAGGRIRGQLDLDHAITHPWSVKKRSRYSQLSVDVVENRILLWCLRTLMGSPIVSAETNRLVRRSYRALAGHVTPTPISGSDFSEIVYNRRNEDYKPLHALSRLILSEQGPSHLAGDQPMVSFLIDMADLFEVFVYEWLREHLRGGWRFRDQLGRSVGEAGGVQFVLDVFMEERQGTERRIVLDTKYKDLQSPSADDVAQVFTYAKVVGADTAFLVYPIQLNQDTRIEMDGVSIRSVSFPLDGDLDEAGQRLTAEILEAA